MAGKKQRYEVWGMVDGEWQFAKSFGDLADADGYCRGMKRSAPAGLSRLRLTDNKGERPNSDYPVKAKAAA